MTKRKLKELNDLMYQALRSIQNYPVRDSYSPEVLEPDIEDFHYVSMELFRESRQLIGKASTALQQYEYICMGTNRSECRNIFCNKKADCQFYKWSHQRSADKINNK